MNYVNAKEFWEMVDRIDQLSNGGKRVLVAIDIQEHATITEVSLNGRVIGEEISDHLSGRTRCYVASDSAAA